MRFDDTVFTRQTIVLDFNDFQGCTFRECELVVHALGPIGLSSCAFEGSQFVFAGPAATTVRFMAGLYHGGGEGGRDLVERTFDAIRHDRSDRLPIVQ